MRDLTIISIHDPDTTDLRADNEVLIEYVDARDLNVEWFIVTAHENAGRVVEMIRPARHLALRILVVDDPTQGGYGHARTFADSPTVHTIEALTAPIVLAAA